MYVQGEIANKREGGGAQIQDERRAVTRTEGSAREGDDQGRESEVGDWPTEERLLGKRHAEPEQHRQERRKEDAQTVPIGLVALRSKIER